MSEEIKQKYEQETCNSIYSGNGQMLPDGNYDDEFVEYALKELKAAKEEIERLKGNINKMFLELGSKWHDNEVTISNPSLFLNSWKREILNK